jgi:3-deoxy-manno-octulosonate cytidylyltransferase (CMP-KDO synthetase)
MNVIGIIPARYASTRFPGKPLVEIHGKSMIQRVYEQAEKAAQLTHVFVATDDSRIYDHVKSFGGKVIMTAANHRTGTERCEETARLIEKEGMDCDVVINIQGDEPYIHPEQIDTLASLFSSHEVQIATLIKKLDSEEEIQSPNIIKVVKNLQNKALYFSRLPIPYFRDKKNETLSQTLTYYKHIGIYAYRKSVLMEIARLPMGSLEQSESLEQLRWLENGWDIYVAETHYESHSVDVPEDLLKFR